MQNHGFISLAAAAFCLAAAPAAAQSGTAELAALAEKAEVRATSNMEWVTINGSVTSVSEDAFKLDYGQGQVRVEMDGFDFSGDWSLEPGEVVSVTGRIDDEFYERRSIEASSIYLDDEKTHYYASPLDEEDGHYARSMADYSRGEEWVAFTGTVVGTPEDGMTIDTGARQLPVDTSGLTYEVKASPGDRVSVYGDAGAFLEGQEFIADSVIRLSQG